MLLAVLLEEGVEGVNLVVQVVEGNALGRVSDHGLDHEEEAVDEGGLSLEVLDLLVDQEGIQLGGRVLAEEQIALVGPLPEEGSVFAEELALGVGLVEMDDLEEEQPHLEDDFPLGCRCLLAQLELSGCLLGRYEGLEAR